MKIQDLSVKSLHRHPDNARDKREYTKKDVAELAASIREHGVLQPLVVRSDGDNYTVLAGHRRHAALMSLGIEKAPCVVLEGDEQESLAVLLGDNATHRTVDPLREASAIAKLVDGFADQKAPYERAAAVLGKSVVWVRGRMRLTALSNLWREAHTDEQSPIHEWPVGHLELVAALPEPVQNEVLDEWTAFVEGVPLAAELRASLARSTQDLSKVPWDRDAIDIVDGAPACSACPFRASAQGCLFADDSKGDRCLNAPCFAAKRRATVAAQIVAAREKYGDALRVESTYGLEDVPVPEGIKVHREFELHARAKSKGGVPVLRLRSLDVAYMIEARTPSVGNQAADGPKRVGPRSMAERRGDLEKRRRIRAIELLCGSMRGTRVSVGTERHPEEIEPPTPQVPTLLDAVALVLVYGTGVAVIGGDDFDDRPSGPSIEKALVATRKTTAKDEAVTRDRLWNRVRGPIARALRIVGPMKPDAVANLAGQAEAICRVCGLDWDAGFLRPAVEAIPEPRSWSIRKAS